MRKLNWLSVNSSSWSKPRKAYSWPWYLYLESSCSQCPKAMVAPDGNRNRCSWPSHRPPSRLNSALARSIISCSLGNVRRRISALYPGFSICRRLSKSKAWVFPGPLDPPEKRPQNDPRLRPLFSHLPKSLKEQGRVLPRAFAPAEKNDFLRPLMEFG